MIVTDRLNRSSAAPSRAAMLLQTLRLRISKIELEHRPCPRWLTTETKTSQFEDSARLGHVSGRYVRKDAPSADMKKDALRRWRRRGPAP